MLKISPHSTKNLVHMIKQCSWTQVSDLPNNEPSAFALWMMSRVPVYVLWVKAWSSSLGRLFTCVWEHCSIVWMGLYAYATYVTLHYITGEHYYDTTSSGTKIKLLPPRQLFGVLSTTEVNHRQAKLAMRHINTSSLNNAYSYHNDQFKSLGKKKKTLVSWFPAHQLAHHCGERMLMLHSKCKN